LMTSGAIPFIPRSGRLVRFDAADVLRAVKSVR
jgi:hypothetical protein